MSTDLLCNEDEGIYLCRFYGGPDKGVCYQITAYNDEQDKYIELTRAQMEEVIKAYNEQPGDVTYEIAVTDTQSTPSS